MKLNNVAVIAFTLLLATSAVCAESDKGPEYPGQVKEDQNGNTVKRWSTKGPVPVNQVSEPFETNKEKSVPSGLLLNIDPQRQGAVAANANKPAALNNSTK